MQVGNLSAKKVMRKVLIRSIPVTLLVGVGIVSFSSEAGSSLTPSPSPAVVVAHATSEWSSGLVR